ncbi:hypothetical protein NDU88_004474 [Pleurodeles waltl]|uniref:Uncharacterized protein n=1 Tax=Pleurodeles waltl TaxID=8319 RepID=A0AAV7NJI4_PLEWA|nr:hypothetical protein NDU88_004474 [Pleurodeles waltl]
MAPRPPCGPSNPKTKWRPGPNRLGEAEPLDPRCGRFEPEPPVRAVKGPEPRSETWASEGQQGIDQGEGAGRSGSPLRSCPEVTAAKDYGGRTERGGGAAQRDSPTKPVGPIIDLRKDLEPAMDQVDGGGASRAPAKARGYSTSDALSPTPAAEASDLAGVSVDPQERR